jgi:hypothetical protein
MAVDLGSEIVFRGDGADEKLLSRFRDAGASAAVFSTPSPEQEQACRTLGLQPLPASGIQFLSWAELAKAKPGLPVALTDGQWPGIARGGSHDDTETASASHQPWVDADSFWAGCARAVAPHRPALLGYRPDEKAGLAKDRVVPFDTLELALADAWAGGGNYLLEPEPRFRAALLKEDKQALTAWAKLARTAAWIRKNAAWFRRPTMPLATALVEPGTESAELANLMYRQYVSPALASAQAPPPPAPGRILVLVAASIHPPGAAARKRILDHAAQGAIVVVDDPAEKAWWRVPGLSAAREEEDRVTYKLGKGQVVAYRKTVEDPSEFALDINDLVTHKKRALRVFRAPSVIGLATQVRPGEAQVLLVNYGSPQRREFTLHVQGVYPHARLERPDQAGVDLKPMRRGSATEIHVPDIDRVAVVILS